MEIWKDIKGYVGLYQISNLGNVKSLEKEVKRKNNRNFIRKEIILKPIIINGYERVSLCKKGKIKYHFIHRLVANAFIENINNYDEINHIDENKQNNCVDNLEWCTHEYNINYGTGNTRRKETEIKTKRGGLFVHRQEFITNKYSSNGAVFSRSKIRL